MARPSLLKLSEVEERQLREAAAESPEADFRDPCRAVLSLAEGATRQEVAEGRRRMRGHFRHDLPAAMPCAPTVPDIRLWVEQKGT
jgi:hypothetical protein